jgi:hypothetical protein
MLAQVKMLVGIHHGIVFNRWVCTCNAVILGPRRFRRGYNKIDHANHGKQRNGGGHRHLHARLSPRRGTFNAARRFR